MKQIIFQTENCAPAAIFAFQEAENRLRLTNLPLYATKKFVSAVMAHFGPARDIEALHHETQEQFQDFVPRIFIVTLSAQALLNFQSYDGQVIVVSRTQNVLSKGEYLRQIYETPTYPTELVAELIKHVQDVPKPELPLTERDIFLKLNKEKSFQFYRFEMEQAREEKVETLRHNEEEMRRLIREQKRAGLFKW